ncbi:MAG: hypothetical protein CL605_03700 [Altibacter sp.]|uniref:hypothetical protein n=1 Tax=Altibacter sp. TaxID=2024823 RepID=UPI000C9291BC|nr:hypothetical protein [Altibacter sp.]MAP53984.1 hypothetical protein [Altibacter sp.]
MAETIVAKRQLGNGRWDRVLKRRMVELSVADNYDDAKEEWIATGEVWWGQDDNVPDWVENSQMGIGKCLCGHSVVYHFEIVNTENGVVECVGSDHINTYLIMRAIAEDTQLPVDAITDEQIQEWINVRVKSMKAKAWWKENGPSFEMMFNAVKEMDLHYNTRIVDTIWSAELERNEPVRKLIKRGSGNFGSEFYRMASIVWRWNHPDNPKAQINTTGYPNDNLMKDLALFYVKSQQLQKEFVEYQTERENRKDEIIERKRLARLAREERERLAAEAERERVRIYNLPENVEKRRLEQERLAQQREQQRLINERRRQERLERERIALEEKKARANRVLLEQSKEFEYGCANYGIPVFDASFASNEWETDFLVDIKERMVKKKTLSPRQRRTLVDIMKRNMPTEKQLQYLKDLGYEGVVKTKKEASEKISELKGDE